MSDRNEDEDEDEEEDEDATAPVHSGPTRVQLDRALLPYTTLHLTP